ncbi:MAG: hypothetical protein IJC43_05445 [Clostridia bacterium]|nr:hypothetical protein [Clostridia bacterium]
MEHQSKPAAGTPLTSLPGVGEAREALLERLGIHCAEDLLRHFPRDYEDRTVVRTLKELREGERCSVRAFVITAPSVARIRKGMEILRFRISDGTAQARSLSSTRPSASARFCRAVSMSSTANGNSRAAVAASSTPPWTCRTVRRPRPSSPSTPSQRGWHRRRCAALPPKPSAVWPTANRKPFPSRCAAATI